MEQVEEDHTSQNEEPTESQQEVIYDLVVIGTGLVESIVAASATKRGKKVLHVDCNDYYGGDFSSSNLSGLLQVLRANESVDKVSSVESTKSLLTTAYPPFFTVHQDEVKDSLAAFLIPSYKMKQVIHPSLLRQSTARMVDIEDPSPEHINPVYLSFLKQKDQLFVDAATKDREFSIDYAQKLIVGTGKYIDCLVYSGVSRYLEFKSTDAIYFYVSKSFSNDKKHLWKVPCSKNDIFNSKQLGPLEKRSLMKFHQFVADWGRTMIGKDVKVLNEKELAQGRSLYRPQNKSDKLDQISTDDYSSKTFEEILQQFGLSSKLKSLILYGLCLYNGDKNSWLAGKGLHELSLHINSLGKYGETAFLNTLYGISEMVQGFCRMSAVWGATYMLRKRIVSFTCPTETIDTSSAPIVLVDDENKTIKCKKLLINAAFNPNSKCKPLFILQSVIVYHGRIFSSSKCIATIPPIHEYSDRNGNTVSLNNKYPICVTQGDSTSCCAPENYSIIHFSTLIDDKTFSSENDTLGSFNQRAKLVSSDSLGLRNDIQAMIEQLAEENFKCVYTSTVLKPIFDANDSGQEGVVYSKGWNYTSMNLEGEVEEATNIIQTLFGEERLFEEDIAEENDGMNDDEEEIDEYEAVYKMAASVSIASQN